MGHGAYAGLYYVTQSRPTLCDLRPQTLCDLDCSLPGFSVHEDSPGKNTGVGCHALELKFSTPVPQTDKIICH